MRSTEKVVAGAPTVAAALPAPANAAPADTAPSVGASAAAMGLAAGCISHRGGTGQRFLCPPFSLTVHTKTATTNAARTPNMPLATLRGPRDVQREEACHKLAPRRADSWPFAMPRVGGHRTREPVLRILEGLGGWCRALDTSPKLAGGAWAGRAGGASGAAPSAFLEGVGGWSRGE